MTYNTQIPVYDALNPWRTKPLMQGHAK